MNFALELIAHSLSSIFHKTIKTTIKKTAANKDIFDLVDRGIIWLKKTPEMISNKYILKWETKAWGEIPADFGRK